jgi:hypothetical protein
MATINSGLDSIQFSDNMNYYTLRDEIKERRR